MAESMLKRTAAYEEVNSATKDEAASAPKAKSAAKAKVVSSPKAKSVPKIDLANVPEQEVSDSAAARSPGKEEVADATEGTQLNVGVPALLKPKIDDVLAVAKQLQTRLATLLNDPKFQVTSVSAGGSALALAIVGSGCGLMTGSATGLAIGVPPSLFTLGLSIPVCTALGGAVGTGVGTVVGGGTGLLGGGVVGNVVYAYRVEIKDRVVYANAKVMDIASATKKRTGEISATARTKAVDTTAAVLSCIRKVNKEVCRRTSELGASSRRVAADPHFQVSAASAASGAVVLGAGGGAVGLTTGAVTGAAVGLVPALFTFGLSVPVGAMIGGSAGLCFGAATGGSAGFVSGGAVGYGSYSKRTEIRSAVGSVWTQAQDSASYVQNKAKDSASFMKTRILGCSTGGTDSD